MLYVSSVTGFGANNGGALGFGVNGSCYYSIGWLLAGPLELAVDEP